MNLLILTIISLNVILNTTAQIALKIGMEKIGHFDFYLANFFPIAFRVALSPWIILGVIIYVGSLGLWLLVLSRTPVSIAYPVSSLAYVTSTIAAYYFLGENLTPVRILGTTIILFGVFLVARS